MKRIAPPLLLASDSKVYDLTPTERHLFTRAKAPRRWQEAHREGRRGKEPVQVIGKPHRREARLLRTSTLRPPRAPLRIGFQSRVSMVWSGIHLNHLINVLFSGFSTKEGVRNAA